MEALKDKYGEKVHFVTVYIREAHAGENRFRDIDQPVKFEERLKLAKRTKSDLSITSLLLIDKMDNRVRRDYGGLPNSAFIIGQNGRVFHKQPWMDSRLIESPLKALLQMGGSSDKIPEKFKDGSNASLSNRRARELKPLQSYKDSPVTIGTKAEIAWINDMSKAKKLARESGVPILAKFYFNNCGYCAAMAKGPLRDPSVVGLSRKFVPVKLNLEKDSWARLAEELEVLGSPAFVVFDSTGKVLIKHAGFAEAEFMKDLLSEGLVLSQTD
ncbi:MAG: hypothetical protein HKN25_16830 [Pyrinomonadaceae bacterium]|nr:hypothetical protein [Pyrinomonadaceae bacterium]